MRAFARPIRAVRHAPATVAVLAAGLALAWPVAAGAALAQQLGSVDLLSQGNVRFDGESGGNAAGATVAAAGDVNADGLADLIVGAPLTYHGRALSGSAYVVFGRASDARVNLGALGGRGFEIYGAKANDRAGSAVSGAGDVNADGYADVIVGAPFADANARTDSGSAYVVFGKPSSATVDLNALGSGGFPIDGAAAGDNAGSSVGRAGDVDGDARADVLVGAPNADRNGRSNSGSAYVVLTSEAGSAIDLAAAGVRATRIDGAAANDQSGSSLAGAGDVDGDQRPDVVIGAHGVDSARGANSGAADVVFGRAAVSVVDLGSLGTRGFRIDGAVGGDEAGYAVAAAGDANADGRADVVVGAPFLDDYLKPSVGAAHVVFGKASSGRVDLDDLGMGGYRILGAETQEQMGKHVSGAGDLNGDGRPDVILGTRYGGRNGRAESGSAWVVFGKSTTTTVDLNAPDPGAFRVDGAAAGDMAGSSAASAGDFNGDGRPDLVLGAPGADITGSTNAGGAHLLYGFGPAAVAYEPILARPDLPIGSRAPVIARTGTPSFSVAPALPAGIALDPQTGVVSGTPAAPSSATYTVTMTDLTGTAAGRLPIAVAAEPVAQPATPPPPPPPPPALPPPLPSCTACKPAASVARLDATIGYTARPTSQQTIFTALFVRSARTGSTIRVSCRGRGCLFASQTREVRRDSARVDLAAVVRRSRLRPGAQLEIRVTRPGTTGIVRRLAVRAGMRPARTDLCLAPGSARPARCAA